jgi:hypothetical protein
VGHAFSGTVFHFTDGNPAATAGDYMAMVTLGDGHSVTLNSNGVVGSGPASAGGQIVAHASGGFDVQLSYTYAKALSNQTFSVQVVAMDGASTIARTTITVLGSASLSKSTIGAVAVSSTLPTVTVTTAAVAPSLSDASTNGLATDAALQACLLDESTVTGKPRPLFEP